MKAADRQSYFVRFRGRVSGPFNLERLRGMAYAGQISPIHEVSVDRATWTPASDVAGLLPAAPEPAPDRQSTGAPAETNPSQDRWYYLDADGNRTGPISRRQLIDLYDQGQVDDGTAVWSKGTAEWVPFQDAGLTRTRSRAQLRLEAPAEEPVRPPAPGVGYGITAMVLGILSLLNSCLAFVPYAGVVFFGFQLVLGVLAICFGAAGMRTRGRGMAITGLVTGIIGVAIFLLMLILFIIVVGSLAAWQTKHDRWD
jgi:GYF domain 2